VLIASLSTVPPRFGLLRPTLVSLLAQSRRPDRVLVTIPKRYRRFPDWDGRPPDLPDGVELIRPETDLGPASKVLPAARAFRGRDCEIFFCDDDLIYPPDLIAALLAGRRQRPQACIAASGYEAARIAPATMLRADRPRASRRWRKTDLGYQMRLGATYLARRLGRPWRPGPTRRPIRRAGYVDIFEGCGGVLVRPDFFDDTAFDIPAAAWPVDDVWLSGMALRREHPVWLVADRPDPTAQPAMEIAPLAHSVVEGANRDQANRACLELLRDRYGIWP